MYLPQELLKDAGGATSRKHVGTQQITLLVSD
jgi:hypothetical protein